MNTPRIFTLKKLTILLIVLCSFHASQAAMKELHTPIYQPVMEYGERLFIPMEFGKSDLSKNESLLQLDPASILKVEVVCTDYPKGINLDQLNQNRLNALLEAKPGLDADVLFCQVIRQMDCPNETQARSRFHGLVITYRPKPTPERMEEEWRLLERLLKGEAIGFDTKIKSSGSVDSRSPVETPVSSSDLKPDTSVSFATRTISTEYSSDSGSTEYVIAHYESADYVLVDVFSSDSAMPAIYLGSYSNTYRPDSTIFRIMKRHPEWKEMMIAADLTGSMYPYAAQILTWLQLNSNDDRVKSFVFFNDGDRKPESEKVIGQIGGIYQGDYSAYPQVKELARKTMNGGGGGDAPENNIEALIKGMDGSKTYEEVVMIADSWAPVKDINLLSQVKQPIRVVVCGGWGPIHSDYFKIARATGGSVHTMEEDLERLAELKEGETVTLNGIIYQLKKGNFIPIKKV